MRKDFILFYGSLFCVAFGACGSNDGSASNHDGAANPGASPGGGAAVASGSGGSASTAAGAGGGASVGGRATGGSGGASTTGAAGSIAMNSPGSTTSLTGTLGALGALQPTVSSLVIANSGEMLIYLSSAPVDCELLTMSRWLGSTPSGSQVVEIVVPSTQARGTVSVEGGAEVNYAPGGMSSAYEKTAASGSVTFTTSVPNGVVEGSVTATYSNPAGNVSGSFHAEFCAGGQGY